MEYTLFILILPLLSFVVLRLMDTKWKPRVAGTIGTLVLSAALTWDMATMVQKIIPAFFTKLLLMHQ